MKKLLFLMSGLIFAFAINASVIDLSNSKNKVQAEKENNKLVVEGRVWKATESELYLEEYPEGYRSWEQTFRGTKEIGDKTYHVLYAKTTAPIESDEYEVAYMREENGKVYSIMNPELSPKIAMELYVNSFAYSEEEALVYDFSATDGTSYYWYGSEENTERVIKKMEEEYNLSFQSFVLSHQITKPIEVYEVVSETQFGRELKVYCYSFKCGGGGSYIELVGDRGGRLPFPGIPNLLETGGVYTLSVFEADGTQIYNTACNAGVKNISAPNIRLDSNTLIVEGADRETRVAIYDVTSKKALDIQGECCTEVSLDLLRPGIYIAKIYIYGENHILKILR